MSVALHERSTAQLRALLDHAMSRLAEAGSLRSACRIGPLSCTVASNSEALHRLLTRCLLPGGSGQDLTIGILSGSHPPFERPPEWNLPHSDARHLERLHVAPDGSLTALLSTPE